MPYLVVAKHKLPQSGSAHGFEGCRHGRANVSPFLSNTPPGDGPTLRADPYDGVFVMQYGEGIFTVGDDVFEAKGGRIVVAPAGVSHSEIG